MRTLIVILLLGSAASSFAGWVAKVRPDDDRFSPGRASIEYLVGEGLPAFHDAVGELVRGGDIQRLDGISLHRLLDDANFQRELFSALERLAPRELAAAQGSAGNMHNPKMTALRQPFEQAVLATPTVKKINADLAPFGLQVSGASQEKLSLIGDLDPPRFQCFLWLTVSTSKRP